MMRINNYGAGKTNPSIKTFIKAFIWGLVIVLGCIYWKEILTSVVGILFWGGIFMVVVNKIGRSKGQIFNLTFS
jgi:hypothetical protein